MIVQISAGQGPEECQIAVGKLFAAWKKEFPDIEEVSRKEGRRKDCFHSILFTTEQNLSDMEGTVLWICKSPVRPEHKRKNWYVDVSIILKGKWYLRKMIIGLKNSTAVGKEDRMSIKLKRECGSSMFRQVLQFLPRKKEAST